LASSIPDCDPVTALICEACDRNDWLVEVWPKTGTRQNNAKDANANRKFFFIKSPLIWFIDFSQQEWSAKQALFRGQIRIAFAGTIRSRTLPGTFVSAGSFSIYGNSGKAEIWPCPEGMFSGCEFRHGLPADLTFPNYVEDHALV